MRVFKNKSFNKFTRKHKIKDSELWDIVDILEADLAEANLGGHVYKVRQAREGKGKSGGYRFIVLFKSKFRTVFVYGFAKSGKSNIKDDELEGYKNEAKDIMLLSENQIDIIIKNRKLFEVFKEEKP